MLVTEPLDPNRHNRPDFSSGVPKVDNFLKLTANKLLKAGNTRVHVLCEDGKTIIGFHALNAHGVSFSELPPHFARTRPGHGSIPAAFIAMIGVDERFQGGGQGRRLLADALSRIILAADQLGIAVVMLDVLDCGDTAKVGRRTALYQSYGFEPLADKSLRMFLPISSIRRFLAGW